MRTKLKVYKRKVYVPEKVENFPDRGNIDAIIGDAAILLFLGDERSVRRDVEYFAKVLGGDEE